MEVGETTASHLTLHTPCYSEHRFCGIRASLLLLRYRPCYYCGRRGSQRDVNNQPLFTVLQNGEECSEPGSTRAPPICELESMAAMWVSCDILTGLYLE